MSYRRAFFLLILIILIAAATTYAFVSKNIDAPSWTVAVAAVIVVGGSILTLFPNLHDSTEFVQGFFNREAIAQIKARKYGMDNPGQKTNRENLLANIKYTWIDGALKNSLHNAVLIELGISLDPEAVNRSSRPWDMLLQMPEENIRIPTEKSIAEVFTERGNSLLILGEPGSGKTITLLQLVEALETEATADDTKPIPVVLNLSSWAEKQWPLEAWIAEEMNVQYQMPRSLTQTWLEHDQLTLLLDGLDEVVANKQDNCVAAINKFKGEFGTDIVVCSRIADYKMLSQRLNLTTALHIQPLTLLQIHSYLNQFGPTIRGFREALHYDEKLQKLAESPLVLSLVPVTYANVGREEIPRTETIADGQRHLFGRYIRQMFRRRPLDTTYSKQQALGWLHNLAQGLAQHNQSIFYIERLQGTWLPSPKLQKRYAWLSRLVMGLTWGLLMWLFTWLVWDLVTGLLLGLVSGLFMGLTSNKEIELKENLVWKMPPFSEFLLLFIAGFLGTFLPPISLGIVTEFDWGVVGFILTPLILTVPIGILLLTLVSALPNSRADWITYLIWGLLVGLGWGLVWSLVFGLIFGLVWGLVTGLYVGLVWGLLVGLVFGLIFGLVLGGFQGQETEKRSLPNQSIRRSFMNVVGFVLAGAVGSLVFGLILWYLDGQLWGLRNIQYFKFGGGLRGGFLAGIPTGILVAISIAYGFGLRTIINHYLLRGLMQQSHYLPAFPLDRKLIDFLDTMADQIIIRRVGAGWQFVHRYLLEYFASLSPAELKALEE